MKSRKTKGDEAVIEDTTQNESGRWKPGQSGNPAGRPKKLPITDALRAELEQEGPDGITNDLAIARKLVEMARAGQIDAVREIADRTEGKVKPRIEEPNSDVSTPVTFEIDL
jgi:hypothetical protein